MIDQFIQFHEPNTTSEEWEEDESSFVEPNTALRPDWFADLAAVRNIDCICVY
jgi:hypothetical protein